MIENTDLTGRSLAAKGIGHVIENEAIQNVNKALAKLMQWEETLTPSLTSDVKKQHRILHHRKRLAGKGLLSQLRVYQMRNHFDAEQYYNDTLKAFALRNKGFTETIFIKYQFEIISGAVDEIKDLFSSAYRKDYIYDLEHGTFMKLELYLEFLDKKSKNKPEAKIETKSASDRKYIIDPVALAKLHNSPYISSVLFNEISLVDFLSLFEINPENRLNFSKSDVNDIWGFNYLCLQIWKQKTDGCIFKSKEAWYDSSFSKYGFKKSYFKNTGTESSDDRNASTQLKNAFKEAGLKIFKPNEY